MIYIRRNKYYNIYNACKLGRTYNIPERDNQYITGEIERGYFSDVYEIKYNNIISIEKELQNNFIDLHIYNGGGREFYNLSIIDKIEPYLQLKKINYKKLSKEEISQLTKCNREENKKINIKPLEYQQNVLNNIKDFYKNNNIGKIIWSCGMGKTLMSLFIIKELKCKKVLIVVPTIYLIHQMKIDILKIFPIKSNVVLFNNNLNKIKRFLNNNDNKNCKFIISTYNSCYLLKDFNFDIKIADECHHLVGIEKSTKSFKLFHKIDSKKTLFMTATEKIIANKDTIKCYSMDNEEIFGKIIDYKSTMWAIENKKITDYNILIIKNTIDELNNIKVFLNINEEININLLLSAYVCLNSILLYNDLTHILHQPKR